MPLPTVNVCIVSPRWQGWLDLTWDTWEKNRFLVSLMALSGFRQEGKELLFAIGDLEERVLCVLLLP